MDELNQALLSIDGPVATLTLNRPEQRNALSVGLLAALHARVDEVERAEGVRVLVVTGAGRAFCAGMDLSEVVMMEGVAWPGGALLASLGRLTLRLRGLPVAVVASVNGAAIGGGCGLSCVADVSITHAEAKVGFPEVDLGICPAVVAPWVVKKIGMGAARRVLLMGGVMSGAQGHALGLFDHLAADREGLAGLTAEVAGRLASGGARALAETKGLLNRLDGSGDEGLVMRGAELSAAVLATEAAQAALRGRMG